MKKLMFILLLLVSMALLVAVESDPSATVGYFKCSVPAGDWGWVSIPFQIGTGSPSEVFGNQFDAGDYLYDPYTQTQSDYYGPGVDEGWYPDDAGYIAPGHFYYIMRAGAAKDYFVLGTVNPAGHELFMFGQDVGGWTPFSLNDCRDILIGDAQFGTLIANDETFEYDQVYDITTGISATWYGPAYGWYASDDLPFYLQPTHCYYFQSFTPSGFTWTYVPPADPYVPAPARTSNHPTIKSTRSSK